MVTNICLAIVLACITFLLFYRRIRVHTWARAWSCLTLLGIVGVIFNPHLSQMKIFNVGLMDLPFVLIWLGLAGQYLYITVLAYRRGYI